MSEKKKGIWADDDGPSIPMTEEEFQQRVKDAGAETGQWGAHGGGKPKTPAFVSQQVGNLTKLRDLLEKVSEGKQQEVLRLQERLHRLKYGGGS